MKADCRQAAKNTVRGGALSMIEMETWHTRKLELRHRSTRIEMATRPVGKHLPDKKLSTLKSATFHERLKYNYSDSEE
jgi:hypothetical protein